MAKSPRLVAEMSKATGVSQADVTKVLKQLGLGRIYKQVVVQNGGKQPSLKAAKVAFRVGRSMVIV
jgi:hypothetical protein